MQRSQRRAEFFCFQERLSFLRADSEYLLGGCVVQQEGSSNTGQGYTCFCFRPVGKQQRERLIKLFPGSELL